MEPFKLSNGPNEQQYGLTTNTNEGGILGERGAFTLLEHDPSKGLATDETTGGTLK